MCAQLRASDVSGAGKRKGGSFISGFSDEGQGKERGASFQHPYLHSAVPTTPETGDLRKTPQLCISSCICSEERQGKRRGGGTSIRVGQRHSLSVTLDRSGPVCKAKPSSPRPRTQCPPGPAPPAVSTHPTQHGAEEPTHPEDKPCINLPAFSWLKAEYLW